MPATLPRVCGLSRERGPAVGWMAAFDAADALADWLDAHPNTPTDGECVEVKVRPTALMIVWDRHGIPRPFIAGLTRTFAATPWSNANWSTLQGR